MQLTRIILLTAALLFLVGHSSSDPGHDHPVKARFMSGQLLDANTAGYRVLMIEKSNLGTYDEDGYEVRIEQYDTLGTLTGTTLILRRRDQVNGATRAPATLVDSLATLESELQSGDLLGLLPSRHEAVRPVGESVLVSVERGLFVVAAGDTARVLAPEELQTPEPGFRHPLRGWPVQYVEHFLAPGYRIYHLRWHGVDGGYDLLDWFVPIADAVYQERTGSLGGS